MAPSSQSVLEQHEARVLAEAEAAFEDWERQLHKDDSLFPRHWRSLDDATLYGHLKTVLLAGHLDRIALYIIL